MTPTCLAEPDTSRGTSIGSGFPITVMLVFVILLTLALAMKTSPSMRRPEASR